RRNDTKVPPCWRVSESIPVDCHAPSRGDSRRQELRHRLDGVGEKGVADDGSVADHALADERLECGVVKGVPAGEAQHEAVAVVAHEKDGLAFTLAARGERIADDGPP